MQYDHVMSLIDMLCLGPLAEILRELEYTTHALLGIRGQLAAISLSHVRQLVLDRVHQDQGGSSLEL